MVRPISNLLKGCSKFFWSEECNSALHEVKVVLKKGEALSQFDPDLPCYIAVDVSQIGLGASLTQQSGDKEHTVAFASRVLRTAEVQYSVIEKELLACPLKNAVLIFGEGVLIKPQTINH